jgi:hypothetical protein
MITALFSDMNCPTAARGPRAANPWRAEDEHDADDRDRAEGDGDGRREQATNRFA